MKEPTLSNTTHRARILGETTAIGSKEKTSGWYAAPRDRETKLATNPRKELVREQLIDIAAELFDKKGYVQTSINDIARALGLGRSAVYHYFRNKEEILAALVEAEALTPSHLLQELIEETGLSATERLRR